MSDKWHYKSEFFENNDNSCGLHPIYTPLNKTSPREKEADFIDLIAKLQDSRYDDQRCNLPNWFLSSTYKQSTASSLPEAAHSHALNQTLSKTVQGTRDAKCLIPPASPKQTPADELNRHRQATPSEILLDVLDGPAPYPMVVVTGGYWMEGTEHEIVRDVRGLPHLSTHIWQSTLNTNESALAYRNHFLDKDHLNWFGEDEALGPLVLSHCVEHHSCEKYLRLILRLRTGTHHDLLHLPSSAQHCHSSAAHLAKLLCKDLVLRKLHPVTCLNFSHLLLSYDERMTTTQFKFGVIYQRPGQIHEEELFSNRAHSPAFEEFLGLLGTRVQLRTHTGYRGGLDTQHGQTGADSVYERHAGCELMFHVSTLLPYSETDAQQLQRKRHIGNDIVSIVFQEASTPFAPDMIVSNFLHTFIVIQPVDACTDHTVYKISVVARDDVPMFGPALPDPAVMSKGADFKKFLLTKLINAEIASYQSERFTKLELHSRGLLLKELVEELRARSEKFCDISDCSDCYTHAQNQQNACAKGHNGGAGKHCETDSGDPRGYNHCSLVNISSHMTSTINSTHSTSSSSSSGSHTYINPGLLQSVKKVFSSRIGTRFTMRNQEMKRCESKHAIFDQSRSSIVDDIAFITPSSKPSDKTSTINVVCQDDVSCSLSAAVSLSSPSILISSAPKRSDLNRRDVSRNGELCHVKVDRSTGESTDVKSSCALSLSLSNTTLVSSAASTEASISGLDMFSNTVRISVSESDDSSLNSVELGSVNGYHDDSDTGMESMGSSNAEKSASLLTPCVCCRSNQVVISNVCENCHSLPNNSLVKVSRESAMNSLSETFKCDGKDVVAETQSICSPSDEFLRQMDELRNQIVVLKNEKLDLLRQNVTCQRDIKRLKSSEMRLQYEMTAASKEVLQLRTFIKDVSSETV